MSGLTKKYLDELTYEVIGAAIEVHKEMGRGLLERIFYVFKAFFSGSFMPEIINCFSKNKWRPGLPVSCG